MADTDSAVRARWTRLDADIARAVRRQCPWWLRDHADDFAQTALVKLMASARQADASRTLPMAYVRRVTQSVIVDEIRRRRRRPEVSLEVDSNCDLVPVTAPRTRDPEGYAASRELGTAMRGCLVRMTPDRRRALLLYLQDHAVPEAAGLLGWTAKRTENLVYRGLAALRGCLRFKGHGG